MRVSTPYFPAKRESEFDEIEIKISLRLTIYLPKSLLEIQEIHTLSSELSLS